MPAERSVPIPPTEPTEGGRGGRRPSVVRSSLELVFSYSRSQQRFFAGLPSAPSFVDSHWGNDDAPTDEENAEWDAEGEQSGYSSTDENEPDVVTDDASNSDASAFFSPDPFKDSRRTSEESPRGTPAGALATVAEAGEEGHAPRAPVSLPSKRGTLLSMYGTTPTVPVSSSVTSSTGDGSGSASGNSANATPRASVHQLPDTEPASQPTRTRRKSQQKGGAGVGAGRSPASMRKRPSETTPLLSKRLGWAPDRLSPLASPARSRRNSSVARPRTYGNAPNHVGDSSDGQTLFNAIAVLVGIGLLSMPLAFSYAGWIGGTIMLVGFSYITCYTAKLLSQLIFADPALLGYTDIGRKAFGGGAGGAINILFCLELFAIGVALIVLLGDSLNAIFPHVSSNVFKVIGFFFILPTTFMPLWLLSVPSVLSTICTVLLIGIVVFDGLWKQHAPGSLIDPMPTHLGPELKGANWLGGIGLVLAGFGGHAVIPSIARDMKNPQSADRVFNIAFTVAGAVAFVAGATGYLMFGEDVSDEITIDLMNPLYKYPAALNLVAVWMIVINPLTKFGLCSRPLNVAVEGFLGLAPNPAVHPPRDRRRSIVEAVSSTISTRLSAAGASDYMINDPFDDRPKSPMVPAFVDPHATRRMEGTKGVLRIVSRTLITIACTLTAILLPGFEKVMAFLGSFSSFLICIILPLGFYLRLSPRLLKLDMEDWGVRTSRYLQVAVIIVSSIMMVLGTVWAFLPGSGRQD